jgi:hypothetical protein
MDRNKNLISLFFYLNISIPDLKKIPCFPVGKRTESFALFFVYRPISRARDIPLSVVFLFSEAPNRCSKREYYYPGRIESYRAWRDPREETPVHGSPKPKKDSLGLNDRVRENKLIEKVIWKSGRSKPPSVQSGIQLCAIPGRKPDFPYALFWLAPAGIHRFIESCRHAQRVILQSPASCRGCLWHPGLGRFMTNGRPCRFCVRAVTLATRTCMRLRIRWVGGLSSVMDDHRWPLSPSPFILYVFVPINSSCTC